MIGLGLFASLMALSAAAERRDLPPGCDCTGVGCQYGPTSDPPQGTLAMFAPNGTNTGNTGGPGFTVSTWKDLSDAALTPAQQVAATFAPPPCFPDTKFLISVLNGSGTQISKVYNSPDLLGPIILNLGGQAGTGNFTFTLDNEPLDHGGLYRE